MDLPVTSARAIASTVTRFVARLMLKGQTGQEVGLIVADRFAGRSGGTYGGAASLPGFRRNERPAT